MCIYSLASSIYQQVKFFFEHLTSIDDTSDPTVMKLNWGLQGLCMYIIFFEFFSNQYSHTIYTLSRNEKISQFSSKHLSFIQSYTSQ